MGYTPDLAEEKNRGVAYSGSCRLRVLGFAAVVLALAVPLGFFHDSPYQRIDSAWYTLIAQGRTAEVMQPFSARQLAPLLARGLAAITHASLAHGFLAVGFLSLVVLALIVGWLLCSGGATWPAFAGVALLNFWPAVFGSFMLPDTLSAALLAVILLALWKRHFLLAAALLLPMFLARESTILVLLCLLIAGWRRLRWRDIALAVASSAAGMAIVHLLSSHGRVNREQLSPLLYMAGKVPWNFASNVLAIGPWMPSQTTFCQVPRQIFTLPLGLHVGGSTLVGLCGWDPKLQMHAVLGVLCSFGLLPLLTVYLLRTRRRQIFAGDLFTRFCVLYGAVSFVIAPALGHSTERLFLYGWPIFLLATPIAASRAFSSNPHNRNFWIALFAIHFTTAWLDMLLFWAWDQGSGQTACTLGLVVITLNVAAWMLLRRADGRVAA